jgi:hypothetical protein
MRSFLATLVSVLLLATACTQSTAGNRQSTAGDIGYCNRLADLYERYIGRSQDAPSRPNLGGSLDADVAAAQCRQGNASGIPALERVLLANGFTLPPHG